MSKSMRLVFFTLPGLIVRFNWRFQSALIGAPLLMLVIAQLTTS